MNEQNTCPKEHPEHHFHPPQLQVDVPTIAEQLRKRCCPKDCPQHSMDSVVGAAIFTHVQLFGIRPPGATVNDQRLDTMMDKRWNARWSKAGEHTFAHAVKESFNVKLL